MVYIYYTLFFLLGYISCVFVSRYSSRLKIKNVLKDINNQFNQILDNVRSGRSKFASRVNNVVYIKTSLIDYGNIDVVYFMDKEDLAIFKDGKCIYTSKEASRKTVLDIISSINIKYKNNINDVVEVMGLVFSREDFEKTFNIDVKQLHEQQSKQMDMLKKIQEDQKSDIQKIIEKNEVKLDLDDILDKISKIGYNNLTKEEKDFLDKLGK